MPPDAMREQTTAPRIWPTRAAAEASAAVYRMVDGDIWRYDVQPRANGMGYTVARLSKDGDFAGFIPA